MWENLNTFQKRFAIVVTIIGSLIGLITGMEFFYERVSKYIDKAVEERVQEHVEKLLSEKKHSFRDELSEEIGIEPNEIPRAFAENYRWVDSLKVFHRALLPMLIQEKKTYDVGLKVDKTTNRMKYLWIDGQEYIVRVSNQPESAGRLFFIDANNVSRWAE